MANVIVCRGCRVAVNMSRAPPGALPEGWVARGGLSYCEGCADSAPNVVMEPRMSEVATGAVIAAISTEPLRSTVLGLWLDCQSPAPHMLRDLVVAHCQSSNIVAPLRGLLDDVLACVDWPEVLKHAEQLVDRSQLEDLPRGEQKPCEHGFPGGKSCTVCKGDPFSI